MNQEISDEPVWWLPLLVLGAYLLIHLSVSGVLQRYTPSHSGQLSDLTAPVMLLGIVLLVTAGKAFQTRPLTLAWTVVPVLCAIGLWLAASLSIGNRPNDATVLAMIVSVFMAPIAEETFFRGFLFPSLATRFGNAVGIGLTSVLFGLFHSPDLFHIGLAIIAGFTFNLIALRSRSLIPAILAHGIYNALIIFL
ncbi:MAG TPA: CPBP family intramembrane glutamic endopeptidase [Symbiobacteriaceae bacterium]|jgi:membrane protease YdiL (CAAX protease family)